MTTFDAFEPQVWARFGVASLPLVLCRAARSCDHRRRRGALNPTERLQGKTIIRVPTSPGRSADARSDR